MSRYLDETHMPHSVVAGFFCAVWLSGCPVAKPSTKKHGRECAKPNLCTRGTATSNIAGATTT